MLLRSVLLGSITACLLGIAPAAAQQSDSAATGANLATGAASAPTPLLPESGIGSGVGHPQEAAISDQTLLDRADGAVMNQALLAAGVLAERGDAGLDLVMQELSSGIVTIGGTESPQPVTQPQRTRQQLKRRRSLPIGLKSSCSSPRCSKAPSISRTRPLLSGR